MNLLAILRSMEQSTMRHPLGLRPRERHREVVPKRVREIALKEGPTPKEQTLRGLVPRGQALKGQAPREPAPRGGPTPREEPTPNVDGLVALRTEKTTLRVVSSEP